MRLRNDEQYRQLNLRLSSPDYESLERSQWRASARQAQNQIDPEIQRRFRHTQRTLNRAEQLWRTYEHSCATQRQLLRDLATLDAQERSMFELDNTKDHIMSVLKLMLSNLLMWTRDRFFPPNMELGRTGRRKRAVMSATNRVEMEYRVTQIDPSRPLVNGLVCQQAFSLEASATDYPTGDTTQEVRPNRKVAYLK